MTAWGATVSEITVASSVISRTNNSTRTARTSFYWKNLYLWSCFSISACVPIDFFPANSCSSAGTGTLLKSRQFFNGNCQTPMGNGWIRTNVNGFKNHLFCDRLRTPYGHCRLRSCDIELWAQRFTIKLSVQKVHIFNSGQRYRFTAAYGFRL